VLTEVSNFSGKYKDQSESGVWGVNSIGKRSFDYLLQLIGVAKLFAFFASFLFEIWLN
jgi:hypothetical protein